MRKEIASIIYPEFLTIEKSNQDLQNLNRELTSEIKKFKPSDIQLYYENKYPKLNLTYIRHETDGDYQIDLRDFIQIDSSIPVVTGQNDDEKALNGLNWVINNIKYTSDVSNDTYKANEYWAYPYQTLKHLKGDCEDGSILLTSILIKSGVPYWKIRICTGNVDDGSTKGGHCYVTYYYEEQDYWVLLDWCFHPNILEVSNRKDYKAESFYISTWFSFNQKYCYAKDVKDIDNYKNIKEV